MVDLLTGAGGLTFIGVRLSVAPTDGQPHARTRIGHVNAHPLKISGITHPRRQPAERTVVTRDTGDAPANGPAHTFVCYLSPLHDGFTTIAVGFTIATTNRRPDIGAGLRNLDTNALRVADITGANREQAECVVVTRQARYPTAARRTLTGVIHGYSGRVGLTSVSIGLSIATTDRIPNIRAALRDRHTLADRIIVTTHAGWQFAELAVAASGCGSRVAVVVTRASVVDRCAGHRRKARIGVRLTVTTAHGVVVFRASDRDRPAHAYCILGVTGPRREDTDFVIGTLMSDDAATTFLAVSFYALSERFGGARLAILLASAVGYTRAIDVAGQVGTSVLTRRRRRAVLVDALLVLLTGGRRALVKGTTALHAGIQKLVGAVGALLTAVRRLTAVFIKTVMQEPGGALAALSFVVALFHANPEEMLGAVGATLRARRRLGTRLGDTTPQKLLRAILALGFVVSVLNTLVIQPARGVCTSLFTIWRILAVHIHATVERGTGTRGALIRIAARCDAFVKNLLGDARTTVFARNRIATMFVDARPKKLTGALGTIRFVVAVGHAFTPQRAGLVDASGFALIGRSAQRIDTSLVEEPCLFRALRVGSAVVQTPLEHSPGPHLTDFVARRRRGTVVLAITQESMGPFEARLPCSSVLAALVVLLSRLRRAIAGTGVDDGNGSAIPRVAPPRLTGGRHRHHPRQPADQHQ